MSVSYPSSSGAGGAAPQPGQPAQPAQPPANNQPPKHPWDAICDAHFAAPTGEAAIKHDTKLAVLLKRSIDCPPEYETTEQVAAYYQHGVQIEQAQQLNLLPYSLAVDPRVQDKSYHGIMSLAYRKWAKRVIEYRYAKEQQVYAETEVEIEARAGNHNDHLHNLGNIVQDELEKGFEYMLEDDGGKVKAFGRTLLALLQEWTKEWILERRSLEIQHPSAQVYDPNIHSQKLPPFSTVEPKHIQKSVWAEED